MHCALCSDERGGPAGQAAGKRFMERHNRRAADTAGGPGDRAADRQRGAGAAGDVLVHVPARADHAAAQGVPITLQIARACPAYCCVADSCVHVLCSCMLPCASHAGVRHANVVHVAAVRVRGHVRLATVGK